MKIACRTQRRLRARLAAHQCGRQSRQQFAQAESTVEAVGGVGQIPARVLAVANGVVETADGAFGIWLCVQTYEQAVASGNACATAKAAGNYAALLQIQFTG